MKMKQLFKNRYSWTCGVPAMDDNGYEVSPTSVKATCWCLSGAIHRCYPEKVDEIATMICNHLDMPNSMISIAAWNDRIANWKTLRKLIRELDL